MNAHPFEKQLKRICNTLLWGSGCVLMFGILTPLLYQGCKTETTVPKPLSSYELNLIQHSLPQDGSEQSERTRYGFELFYDTPTHLGPENKNGWEAYSGNHLACSNCHLHGGTKAYAAPLIGVVQRFPQYRGREDKMGTIEERINGCFERSMNGRMLDPTSEEMKAFVAYLNWLGRDSDGKHAEKGFVALEIPKRAVDLKHGKQVFEKQCALCHGADGQGKRGTDSYYQYPPLWGPDSYNNGAGMTRVLTAARFIKGNMPYGATYDNPILTDAEAYDVGGFINQQARPVKANLPADFPNKLKKPVSTPYPPYSDNFSFGQHQLGPFQPIIAYYWQTHGIKKTK
jgi:thiosulfate dehydrogenase